jgi:hypothetical protein
LSITVTYASPISNTLGFDDFDNTFTPVASDARFAAAKPLLRAYNVISDDTKHQFKAGVRAHWFTDHDDLDNDQ